MNPGLVVKLRPAGPWRIGPDSGARNRVDAIYHSDSLFSAATGAMARLGSLEEWLDATARGNTPAVSFSSCFPFLDEIGFVVPPRTIWPPTSPALLSPRVRWKSARFVPLGIVQALLAGQALDAEQWSVDGASECLVPAGRPGPFRTGVRWNAAVDRLTGSTERHSTACIEFRPGSGLWTVVAFADEVARDRWQEPVKAIFRLLADSGFGGERSRGWGRSEQPEFIEGVLPDLILPAAPTGGEEQVVEAQEVQPPEVLALEAQAPEVQAPVEPAPEVTSSPAEVDAAAASAEMVAEGAPETESPATEAPAPVPEPELAVTEPAAPVPETEPLAAEAAAPAPEPEPVATEAAAEPKRPVTEPTPAPKTAASEQAHWLLSLFTPAPADTVDWRRGNYFVVERGGRVDSPAGSGELKKQLQMIAEGSVLYATDQPRGAAADVAPDGFAHPVFRAGFAVAIPLPEVR
jgi:CRISPR type III-A-associated RAMP protein Csm4